MESLQKSNEIIFLPPHASLEIAILGGCACASGVHWEFLGHPRDFQPINGRVFGSPDSSACCFSRGKVGKYVVLQAFYKNFEDPGIKFYSCICWKIPKYFRHKGKTSEHGETNCFSQIWALNSALVRARRMLSSFWCGFSVNVKVKSVLYCFMSLNLYEF